MTWVIVAVRLLLSVVLVLGVYREAGPWTATAIALGIAAFEIAARRLRQ